MLNLATGKTMTHKRTNEITEKKSKVGRLSKIGRMMSVGLPKRTKKTTSGETRPKVTAYRIIVKGSSASKLGPNTPYMVAADVRKLLELQYQNELIAPALRADAEILDSLNAYTEEEIYTLVVPKRTLARRKDEKEPLTTEETDKALRLARIAKLAEEVFGDAEKAARWLRKPKRTLEGETPLAFLASETGARTVEEMLTRIDSGIIS